MQIGIGLGFSKGRGGGGAVEFPRAWIGNGNVYPFQLDSSANNFRSGSHRKELAGDAVYTKIRGKFPCFTATPTNEVSTGTGFTLRACLRYNGSSYPLTFGGASSYALAAGSEVEWDPVPGLVMSRAIKPYYNVDWDIEGPPGTLTYPRTCVSWAVMGEGTVNSSSASANFSDGTLACDAEATATVSSGNITAGTVTAGGRNYTQNAQVWAYETVGGVTHQKNVGTAVRTGSVITSISITSGTPPAGLAAWVSPSLSIAYGSAHMTSSNAIASYTCCEVSGIPDREVESVVIFSDSIGRGGGEVQPPDPTMNQGILERGIANRCGVMNAGIGSGKALYFGQTTAVYPKLFASVLGSGIATKGIIQLGTNDGRFDTISLANLTTRINALKTYLQSFGIEVSVATILPRTVTDINTPATAWFENAGIKDQFNEDVIDGTISSDWGYIPIAALLENPADKESWGDASYTVDFVHPRGAGLGKANTDATYQDVFADLDMAGRVQTPSGEDLTVPSGATLRLPNS